MVEVFHLGNYIFKNYTCLSREESHSILSMRNHPDVRLMMASDRVINEDEHLAFIEALKSKHSDFFFAVIFSDKVIGNISYTKIDNDSGSALWGLWLGTEYLGSGLGVEVQFWGMNIAFNLLKLKRLSAMIRNDNYRSLKLHRFFGFNSEPIGSQMKFSIESTQWEMFPADFNLYRKEVFKRKLTK